MAITIEFSLRQKRNDVNFTGGKRVYSTHISPVFDARQMTSTIFVDVNMQLLLETQAPSSKNTNYT